MEQHAYRINEKKYKSNKKLETFINGMEICVFSSGINKLENPINKYILPSFLLIYGLEGETFYSTSGNEQSSIKAGSFSLFEPFTLVNSIHADTKANSYMYIYFCILPLSSASIFKRCAFETENVQIQQAIRPHIDCMFKTEILSGYQNVPFGNFLLQYLVRGAIAYILYNRQQHYRNVMQLSSQDTKLLDIVFSYTDKHLSDPINISKLSLDIGISYSSLNRAFQKAVKMTPCQFITKYKISQAVMMLRQGFSIKATAKNLGYSSSFHFSKVFKHILGQSPSIFMQGN